MDDQNGSKQDIDQQLPPYQKPRKHSMLYLSLVIILGVIISAGYIVVRKPFNTNPVPEAQQQDYDITKEAENMPQIFKDNPPNKEMRQPGGAAEL